MSYKYSKGSQVIGDLKAADDTQRDTLIDFGEDVIDFQTSGSSVLKISGSHVYLASGSDLHLFGSSRIYFDSDDVQTNVMIFERDDGDGLIIDGNNRLRFKADDYVIFEAPDGSESILVNYQANPDVLRLQMLVSSSQPISASAIASAGNVTLDGTEPKIVLKEGGSDRAEIGINDSDNLVIENKSTNKHIVFKANDNGTTREGLRLDGAVPEVVVNQSSDSLVDFRVESDNNTHMLFVDGGNDRVGLGVSTPVHSLEVSGNVYLSGTLSHGDVMLLELSVPNVDLQTDTYAHRIYAPYNLDVDNVMYILDSHNTSGNVTVTLTNTTSNVVMSSVTMAGTAVTGSDFTITSASVAQGDSLTFAITEAAGVSQGLHAMLYFRRSI
jgi:archaellum component FlaF (FlaF/FlaG flagellin family)